MFVQGREGRSVALRQIAKELGVTLRTVQNWRDKDGWAKLREEAVFQTGKDPDVDVTTALKEHMTGMLLGHIKRLDAIIKSKKTKPADRIRATGEYVSIYRRLGASLDSGGRGARPGSLPFNDNL
jgi:uncharacterized protein YjcR